MARVRREDIRWALIEEDRDRFFGDRGAVVLFDTRKEARKYAANFEKFYRRHEMDLKSPRVVKVRVNVTEIKREEVSDD